jgi:hypothetical protein
MTDEIQWMSYELMRRFCPAVDGPRWRTLHGSAVAMNNGTQNGYNETESHADFINGMDFAAPLPRYDKMQRLFQGSFFTGKRDGDLIWCVPGVDGIDATKPLPTIDEIVERNWYVVAVCTGSPPFHFRPTWGGWIVYPFILDRLVAFEAKYFTTWDETFLPDPLTQYVRKA